MESIIYTHGDFYHDYLIKKKFYDICLKKIPEKALTLTMCYYNKFKYKVVYNQVSEQQIQEISKYL